MSIILPHASRVNLRIYKSAISLRELSCLTTQQPLWQSHSHRHRLSLLRLRPLCTLRYLLPSRNLIVVKQQLSNSWSNSLSWCLREGTPNRRIPGALYSHSLSLLQSGGLSPGLLVCLWVSSYPADPHVSTVPFVVQRVGDRSRLTAWGSQHAELNLQLATWPACTVCIPQHLCSCNLTVQYSWVFIDTKYCNQ